MSQSDSQKPAYRELRVFGVAGALSDQCEVLYQSVFDTRQIGRIADLLSAKYEPERVDDLRLRVLILFSLFAAWEQQRTLSEESPILLEVGVDEHWVAVGVSFSPEKGQSLALGKLAERVSSREFKTRFDETVAEIASHAPHLLIRYLADETRMELVAFFERTAFQQDSTIFSPTNEVMVVEVDPALTAPPSSQVTELGDLDYPRLLESRNQKAAGRKDP